jgi:hypothetical protein
MYSKNAIHAKSGATTEFSCRIFPVRPVWISVFFAAKLFFDQLTVLRKPLVHGQLSGIAGKESIRLTNHFLLVSTLPEFRKKGRI